MLFLGDIFTRYSELEGHHRVALSLLVLEPKILALLFSGYEKLGILKGSNDLFARKMGHWQ